MNGFFMSDLITYGEYKNYFTSVYSIQGVIDQGLGAFAAENDELVYRPLLIRPFRYLLAFFALLFSSTTRQKNQKLTAQKMHLLAKAMECVNTMHKKLEHIPFAHLQTKKEDEWTADERASIRAARLYNRFCKDMESWTSLLTGSSLSPGRRYRYHLEKRLGLAVENRKWALLPPSFTSSKQWERIPTNESRATHPRSRAFRTENERIRLHRFRNLSKKIHRFFIKAGFFANSKKFYEHCDRSSFREKRLCSFFQQPLDPIDREEALETFYLCTRTEGNSPMLLAEKKGEEFPLESVTPPSHFGQTPQSIFSYVESLRLWYGGRMKIPSLMEDPLLTQTVRAMIRILPSVTIQTDDSNVFSLCAEITKELEPLPAMITGFYETFPDLPITEKKGIFFENVVAAFVKKHREMWDERQRNHFITWADQEFVCGKLTAEGIEQSINRWTTETEEEEE